MKPRLLDLFCGAGGAAMGYHRAGFDVVGVDINPQPNYPFPFVQADALDWLEEWVLSGHDVFDAIHASSPCQRYVAGFAGVNRARGYEHDRPDLIDPTRELLQDSRLPYVIENVPGAPLRDPVQLCGSSFGLGVRRHRLFECSFPLLVPSCFHGLERGDYWTSWMPHRRRGQRSRTAQVYGNTAESWAWPEAMGIDWMTPYELTQAIPPAYTEYVGQQLLAHIQVAA